MIRSIANLARNSRGAVIIELAMVAPVLAIMVIGVVDMSNAFSRKLALEQGAQRAVEKIMQTTDYETVEDTLKTEAVCQVNGMDTSGTCKTSPITTSNATVTWRQECSDSSGSTTVSSTQDSTAFNSFTCPSAKPKEARYLQIALTDKYTPMFPLHFSSFDADGSYHMSATAGMRIPTE